MFKRKEKAFTLIELIATLVIIAILALIVIPLVMSIIRKARISADKRSIDAYGRSIELAIAGYLMDNGSFPTNIDQLTIEYSGDEVRCETIQINTDSSVYLVGCTVAGRSVEGYTYGKEETVSYKAYSIGDEVTYNNVDYYVIKDSATSDSTLTLLKATPLTVDEVNQYGGVGTANNHVNMYANPNVSSAYYKKAYNQNGYGGMQYYSNATCNGYGDSNGCTNVYEDSEVKYVVDTWKITQAPAASEARLIKYDEFANLGYEWGVYNVSNEGYVKGENTPSWVYNNNYFYWTMAPDNDSLSWLWYLDSNGTLSRSNAGSYEIVVRPVIVLDKSVL